MQTKKEHDKFLGLPEGLPQRARTNLRTEKRFVVPPLDPELQAKIRKLEVTAQELGYLNKEAIRTQLVKVAQLCLFAEKVLVNTLTKFQQQTRTTNTSLPTRFLVLKEKQQANISVLYPQYGSIFDVLINGFNMGYFQVVIVNDTEEVLRNPVEIRIHHKKARKLSRKEKFKSFFDEQYAAKDGQVVTIYLKDSYVLLFSNKNNFYLPQFQNLMEEKLIEAYYDIIFNLSPNETCYEPPSDKLFVTYQPEVTIKQSAFHGRPKSR